MDGRGRMSYNCESRLNKSMNSETRSAFRSIQSGLANSTMRTVALVCGILLPVVQSFCETGIVPPALALDTPVTFPRLSLLQLINQETVLRAKRVIRVKSTEDREYSKTSDRQHRFSKRTIALGANEQTVCEQEPWCFIHADRPVLCTGVDVLDASCTIQQ